MTDTSKIEEHMLVYGSCGDQLGTVDHVLGDKIKLTKGDPMAGGVHHLIPTAWVSSVDKVVRLSKNCEAAKREWVAA